MPHEDFYKEELYKLDDVHLDELLQHVIDSQGSELILAPEKPPAIRFLLFDGEVKEIRAYENLRAPILQRMIEDILTDQQIGQLKRETKLSDSYTTADVSARYEFEVTCDGAGMTAKFFLLPQTFLNLKDA